MGANSSQCHTIIHKRSKSRMLAALTYDSGLHGSEVEELTGHFQAVVSSELLARGEAASVAASLRPGDLAFHSSNRRVATTAPAL